MACRCDQVTPWALCDTFSALSSLDLRCQAFHSAPKDFCGSFLELSNFSVSFTEGDVRLVMALLSAVPRVAAGTPLAARLSSRHRPASWGLVWEPQGLSGGGSSLAEC